MKRLCRALPLLCFREWKTEVCMREANDERDMGSPQAKYNIGQSSSRRLHIARMNLLICPSSATTE
ncbi:hypothetical protein NC653_040035 [Populus alba x Populus x berolinensis]|uniref:Uncharacterized protein n=1 Tax=Populus alba x Populus x berolinensis TaxID=444605 RepID=A0AAD6LFA7_9ROSI|nr:hypothetical protein NC653_040035 [Populus alba x Populus x berolinensis]